MRISCKALMFALGLLLPAAVSAQQITAKDIQRVASYVQVHRYPRRLLLWEAYPDGGWQSVFVYEGHRYTIFVAGVKEFVSFWVRKEGTTGQSGMVTFSDMNRDGKVDFGIAAAARDTSAAGYKKVKYFRSNDDPLKELNPEFRNYWQAQLNRAVRAALLFYKKTDDAVDSH